MSAQGLKGPDACRADVKVARSRPRRNAALRRPRRSARSFGPRMAMIEILRTNDAVALSLAEALLGQARIECFVADRHMSALEGSIGAFQRRLLVDRETRDQGAPHSDRRRARRLFASRLGVTAENTEGFDEKGFLGGRVLLRQPALGIAPARMPRSSSRRLGRMHEAASPISAPEVAPSAFRSRFSSRRSK